MKAVVVHCSQLTVAVFTAMNSNAQLLGKSTRLAVRRPGAATHQISAISQSSRPASPSAFLWPRPFARLRISSSTSLTTAICPTTGSGHQGLSVSSKNRPCRQSNSAGGRGWSLFPIARQRNCVSGMEQSVGPQGSGHSVASLIWVIYRTLLDRQNRSIRGSPKIELSRRKPRGVSGRGTLGPTYVRLAEERSEGWGICPQ